MTGSKRKKKSVLWSKMHIPHCEDFKQWCRRRLPILQWAPHYNLKENLLPDTVSGIMLAVQQVTQGNVPHLIFLFYAEKMSLCFNGRVF